MSTATQTPRTKPTPLRLHILALLQDGQPWTVPALQKAVETMTGRHYMETTVSAKIRDLRKSKYGGHDVPDPKEVRPGLWAYRYVPPVKAGQMELEVG